MSDFFRFPHTPHLAWLSLDKPRDDKLLTVQERQELLSHPVVIEEKIDGANLGISVGAGGQILVQNRGQYLSKPYRGQFSKLNQWLDEHESFLRENLDSRLILFGEWCAARHSIRYDMLPDWYLIFDVYDRFVCKFWSTSRRNKLATKLNMKVAPELFRGLTTFAEIQNLILSTKSQYSECALEGVVIRHESDSWCEEKAKLVRPDFTQSIEGHWRKRNIEWNYRSHA